MPFHIIGGGGSSFWEAATNGIKYLAGKVGIGIEPASDEALAVKMTTGDKVSLKDNADAEVFSVDDDGDIVGNTLQFGASGSLLRDNSGVIESRNNGNTDYGPFKGKGDGTSFSIIVLSGAETVNAADATELESAIDYFVDKNIYNSKIKLTSAGTFSISNPYTKLARMRGNLTIEGHDVRGLDGHTFVDGDDVTKGGGSGLCSLSNNATYDIDITGVTTNPDVTDYGSGDKVGILDDSYSYSEYDIDSTSSNRVTLTTAAPTVGGLGTSITFIPASRIISTIASGFGFGLGMNNNLILSLISVGLNRLYLDQGKVILGGFHVHGNGATGISVVNRGVVEIPTNASVTSANGLYNLYAYRGGKIIGGGGVGRVLSVRNGGQSGVRIIDDGEIFLASLLATGATSGPCATIQDGGILNAIGAKFFTKGHGVRFLQGGRGNLGGAEIYGDGGGSDYGANVENEAYCRLNGATIDNFGICVRATEDSQGQCSGTICKNANTGFHASYMSRIRANSTLAAMVSVTTPSSPAISDTVGNVGSYITIN